MQDAPDTTAVKLSNGYEHNWYGVVTHPYDDDPSTTEYTRTDLCITEAECQRRIDAAVQAERDVLVDLADDIIRASNTLMLMLSGGLGKKKDAVETELCRAMDARANWDAYIRARGKK